MTGRGPQSRGPGSHRILTPAAPLGASCWAGRQPLSSSKHPLDQAQAPRPEPASSPGTSIGKHCPFLSSSALWRNTPPRGRLELGDWRGPWTLAQTASQVPLEGGGLCKCLPRPARATRRTTGGSQFPSSSLLELESLGEICVLLHDTEMCLFFFLILIKIAISFLKYYTLKFTLKPGRHPSDDAALRLRQDTPYCEGSAFWVTCRQ